MCRHRGNRRAAEEEEEEEREEEEEEEEEEEGKEEEEESNREHESQIFTQIPKPTCVRADKEEQSATSIVVHHQPAESVTGTKLNLLPTCHSPRPPTKHPTMFWYWSPQPVWTASTTGEEGKDVQELVQPTREAAVILLTRNSDFTDLYDICIGLKLAFLRKLSDSTEKHLELHPQEGTNVVFCRKENLCVTQQVFHLAQGCAPDIVPEGERCLLNQKFLSFPQNMSIRTFIVGHRIHMENFLQQNKRRDAEHPAPDEERINRAVWLEALQDMSEQTALQGVQPALLAKLGTASASGEDPSPVNGDGIPGQRRH
ncbi:hypothetical protein Q9966_015334 [Columba livia]|nr:hypothetical protein Q9966_015334 [Columba livia]